MTKAHLFDEIEDSFVRLVTTRIHPVLYLPGQLVLTRGEVGHHMFFVQKGEVEVLSPYDDETNVVTLKEGKLFGEV